MQGKEKKHLHALYTCLRLTMVSLCHIRATGDGKQSCAKKKKRKEDKNPFQACKRFFSFPCMHAVKIEDFKCA